MLFVVPPPSASNEELHINRVPIKQCSASMLSFMLKWVGEHSTQYLFIEGILFILFNKAVQSHYWLYFNKILSTTRWFKSKQYHHHIPEIQEWFGMNIYFIESHSNFNYRTQLISSTQLTWDAKETLLLTIHGSKVVTAREITTQIPSKLDAAIV